jgi:hypothetical protein
MPWHGTAEARQTPPCANVWTQRPGRDRRAAATPPVQPRLDHSASHPRPRRPAAPSEGPPRDRTHHSSPAPRVARPGSSDLRRPARLDRVPRAAPASRAASSEPRRPAHPDTAPTTARPAANHRAHRPTHHRAGDCMTDPASTPGNDLASPRTAVTNRLLRTGTPAACTCRSAATGGRSGGSLGARGRRRTESTGGGAARIGAPDTRDEDSQRRGLGQRDSSFRGSSPMADRAQHARPVARRAAARRGRR